MKRTVSADITGTVTESAHLVWSVAVAHHPGLVEERLTVQVDGDPVEVREIQSAHGGRLHVVPAAPTGELTLSYRAVVEGRAEEQDVPELDLISYRNPSRYADSDRLANVAGDEFRDLRGHAAVDAIVTWVHTHLLYLSGSSRVTDGATDSYVARAGVCRDFAHLVITFLRARGFPARLAAVYAPGLSPMDFHAVVEVYVESAWHVVDATRLAPRESLLRISTGRDAADTAFLNVLGGRMKLGALQVSAVVDSDLPAEEPEAAVRLG